MKKFPPHGWIGLTLIVLLWYLNWHLSGLRTHWGFFFLWLGYVLAVDGLVYKRKGTSLIFRNVKKFITLFFISAPTWWLFELFNNFTKNWHYAGREYFSDIQYFLLASLSFSTVMPAVFGTAELASSFKWIKNFKSKKKIGNSNNAIKSYFLAGCLMLLLIIFLPEYFYYLIWVALYFIIDPVNYRLGNRSILDYVARSDWTPAISLAVGCLICGFFWEMWNYYSYPKWIYNLPYLNFFHVFEMPILGYIGYIPFSIELFSVYNLVSNCKKKDDEYYFIKF